MPVTEHSSSFVSEAAHTDSVRAGGTGAPPLRAAPVDGCATVRTHVQADGPTCVGSGNEASSSSETEVKAEDGFVGRVSAEWLGRWADA